MRERERARVPGAGLRWRRRRWGRSGKVGEKYYLGVHHVVVGSVGDGKHVGLEFTVVNSPSRFTGAAS